MPAFALSMLVGLFAGYWMPLSQFAGLACICAVGLIPVWFRCFSLVAALTGYVLAVALTLNYLDQRLPDALEGRDLLLRGCISSFVTAEGVFEFRVTGDSSWTGQSLSVRLNSYHPEFRPVPGECWQLLVRLKAPHGQVNPGLFDRELWMFVNAQVASGYVRKANLNRRIRNTGFGHSLLELRHELSVQTAELSGNSALAPLIQGITTGVRGGLTDDQWRILRETGTSHLMAISGLHIGLVAWFCWCLTIALSGVSVLTGRGDAPAWLAPVISAVGATLYAMLGGWSLPTRRALCMTLMVLALTGRNRRMFPVNSLAAAAVFVMMLDPAGILSGGFWLSFIAVASLLVFTRGQEGAGLHRAINAQLVLGICLAVPTMFFFGGVSLVAPAANLVAVPVFSFLILPFALLGLAVLATGSPLAVFPLRFAEWVLGQLLDFLEMLAGVAGAWVSVDATGLTILMLIAALCAGLLTKLYLSVLVCFGMLLLGTHGNWVSQPPLQISVLDVGQGLAVIVRTQNRTLLYDAGPAWDGGDAGNSTILPVFRNYGVRTLDALVISHGDNDHSGGVSAVLKAIPTTGLFGPPEFTEVHPNGYICRSGIRWSWDGVDFEFLHPRAHGGWSDNNASCVLRISLGQHSFLLSGDIEEHAERVLLSRAYEFSADLLLAPHHGSRTSSSEAFVQAVRPRYAVFATGYANRWSFPAPAVQARYRDAGACLLNTAYTGALEFSLSPQQGLTLDAAAALDWRRPWVLRHRRQRAVNPCNWL